MKTIPASAHLVLLPTGAGESRTLTDGSIACRSAKWFPDGNRIMIVAQESGQRVRTYVHRGDAERPQPLTPEGMAGILISPDGLRLIVSNERGVFSLFPLEGSAGAHPIAGLAPGDQPIQWTADGRSIYVRRNVERTGTARVFRLDLSTGAVAPWKEDTQDTKESDLPCLCVLLSFVLIPS